MEDYDDDFIILVDSDAIDKFSKIENCNVYPDSAKKWDCPFGGRYNELIVIEIVREQISDILINYLQSFE